MWQKGKGVTRVTRQKNTSENNLIGHAYFFSSHIKMD